MNGKRKRKYKGGEGRHVKTGLKRRKEKDGSTSSPPSLRLDLCAKAASWVSCPVFRLLGIVLEADERETPEKGNDEDIC